MKKKKTVSSTAPAPPPSPTDDFNAFLARHSMFAGSALVIYETTERDQNGQFRWAFTHRGEPALLEMMAAQVMGRMSAARERKLAELARGPRG